MFLVSSAFLLILPGKMSFNDVCDINDQDCVAKNNWAIVPYVDHYPLQQFSQKINEIYVGDEKYVIHQSWQSVGVAGIVWDSSITLAVYLHNHSHLVANKTLLELGAGTGLPSIVAAKLGAKVAITDMPKALELIIRNVNENLKNSEKYEIKIEPLIWNQINLKDEKFYDVILGADLIYDENLFDDLISTLNFYSNPMTEVYLSIRIRYDKNKIFFVKLRKYFTVDEIFYDIDKDVRLYLCRKLIA